MKLSVFSDAIALLYYTEENTTFPQRFYEALEMILPNPLITLDLINRPNEKYQDALNWEVPEFIKVASRFKELVPIEHPYVLYLKEGGRANLLRTNDLVTQRELEQTCIFNEILRPFQIKTQMVGYLSLSESSGPLCTSINRDGSFSVEEREITSLFLEHAHLAFQRNTLIHDLRKNEVAVSRDDFEVLRRKGLTRRECEIIVWLVEGKRDKEIGLILKISPRTVHTHLRNISTKLSTETRSATIATVLRLLEKI